MTGAPLNTLDAVVAGQTLVPISLDYVAPPPGQTPTPLSTEPVQVASMQPVGTR